MSSSRSKETNKSRKRSRFLSAKYLVRKQAAAIAQIKETKVPVKGVAKGTETIAHLPVRGRRAPDARGAKAKTK